MTAIKAKQREEIKLKKMPTLSLSFISLLTFIKLLLLINLLLLENMEMKV
jgi:hypothetical protein